MHKTTKVSMKKTPTKKTKELNITPNKRRTKIKKQTRKKNKNETAKK